jgi:hypothetical protein
MNLSPEPSVTRFETPVQVLGKYVPAYFDNKKRIETLQISRYHVGMVGLTIIQIIYTDRTNKIGERS